MVFGKWLTLKMTTAQVVETSVTNNSLSKDYLHPDNHDKPINGFFSCFTHTRTHTHTHLSQQFESTKEAVKYKTEKIKASYHMHILWYR